ncbi:hypothetical protein CFC21_087531 [Triticum aestivum]|uniref:Uncharacterized protein n=3 Tax=Triticum TaxID=4564 RepID=A0A9R1B8V6_TRITD|nr:uncharacterized protein LOC123136452 isoform X3 [Triticum aestivum]KAF7083778.1 hypothetical protein CFC21_087531 [Triticum aestivum]VAI55789.1 unnamed protein product [Triticum turgidum subsp. durum]
MARVSNPCHPDLRIYEPNFASEQPRLKEESKSRSYLLQKIRSYYGKAQKLLGRSHRLQGLCVGLLDPASNIVINSLIERKHERERDRDHRSTTCEVVVEDDLKRRSLDGMVVFLTRLFPNLSEGLAVRYLRLAKADVLIAACIVVSDQCIEGFDASGPDVINMALRCAGLAARHPDAYRFVFSWCNISSRIDDALRLLAALHEPQRLRRSDAIIKLVHMLNYEPPSRERDVWLVWRLAEASFRRRPRSAPQLHTNLLNRTLQDTIHGYYLQALALLPPGSRFHRSLIKAGYCYGPFDPVSNIIINTIWYDANFPPSMKLELDVMGTRSLHRVENRSLYGMVSFLCTRYHELDFHQAVRCLLQADANLVLADPNLVTDTNLVYDFGIVRDVLRHGPASAFRCKLQTQAPPNTGLTVGHPDTGIEEAFLAAATAACHPNPDAQAQLLTSCCKVDPSPVLSLLPIDSHKLSFQDLSLLARFLSCNPLYEYDKALPLPPVPLKCYPRAELASLYTVISKEVNALLNKYQQMPNGDPKFKLHMICVVNDRVRGPAPWPPHRHGHSHVNFVATSKSPGGEAPTLFFAEINADNRSMSFCCPVDLPPPCAAQIPCIYCESMGTRIVHPVGIHFTGRDSEFENMACEKDPLGCVYATMRIINHRRGMAESVHVNVKEDSLYDGMDGHKSKYDIETGSLSMKEYVLLIPALI